jgi:hypothetical protein
VNISQEKIEGEVLGHSFTVWLLPKQKIENGWCEPCLVQGTCQNQNEAFKCSIDWFLVLDGRSFSRDRYRELLNSQTSNQDSCLVIRMASSEASIPLATEADLPSKLSLFLTSFRRFSLFPVLYSPLSTKKDAAFDTIWVWRRRLLLDFLDP